MCFRCGVYKVCNRYISRFVCCSIAMLYYHIIVLIACLNILPNPQPASRDLKCISNICCVISGSLRWIVDLVINQTDGYLFSGRDFLPRVQIRLTITTDEPSPKAFILELQIICGTYIRAYMWRLPDSNIGFSDPIPSHPIHTNSVS